MVPASRVAACADPSRVRSRALIERSAPVVSGVGAIISLTMMLAELTGGDPDYGYVIRLGCSPWY